MFLLLKLTNQTRNQNLDSLRNELNTYQFSTQKYLQSIIWQQQKRNKPKKRSTDYWFYYDFMWEWLESILEPFKFRQRRCAIRAAQSSIKASLKLLLALQGQSPNKFSNYDMLVYLAGDLISPQLSNELSQAFYLSNIPTFPTVKETINACHLAIKIYVDEYWHITLN